MNEEVMRPWGTYRVLYNEEKFKIKKIMVHPEQEISYQYHHKREELWHIIEGVAEVTLDDVVRRVEPGSTVKVPALSKHTIRNIDTNLDLVFIEIQTGQYFGEDDIVRIKDRYGRI